LDLFGYPTIAALAGFLSQGQTNTRNEGRQRGEKRRQIQAQGKPRGRPRN